MTLLLVGLCGAVLARIAQLGIGQALAASRAAEDLQQRWARQSCQLQLLPRAEWLIESAAAATEQDKLGWPFPATVESRFGLGQIKCEVVLADEEARPNLNLLHAEQPQQTMLVASSPFRGTYSRPLAVKLSPALVTPNAPEARCFNSWGQVYDLASAGTDIRSLRAPAFELTCWGSRRLNVARASDAAIELVSRLALNGGDVQSLVEARAGYAGDLNEILKQLDIPGPKKVRLRRLLTDRSSCYSMWLAMTRGDRTSAMLAVHDAGRRDIPATIAFYWP